MKEGGEVKLFESLILSQEETFLNNLPKEILFTFHHTTRL